MASSIDTNRLSGTRHADLSTKLRAAIVAGQFAQGSLLPTEHELAQIHGVSRQTVRTALQTLEDLGYISRKKGVGTRVEADQPSAGFVHAIESLEDLVQVAAAEARQILTVESVTLDRALAKRYEAQPGSQWICFSGLRVDVRNTSRPISGLRVLIDKRFAGIVSAVNQEPTVLVAALLERESGEAIEEVHQKVSAMILDRSLAQALEVKPGAAALRILRHYKGSRRNILEITETIYPSDRVTVSSLLRRKKSNGSKL